MMRRSTINYWLLCVFIVAATLRLYQLDRVPISLSWDEVAMLVDVKAVLATGRDMHGGSWFQAIFPSWGDYKLPVYLWSSALAAHILGATTWAVRIPSALAGAATVLLSAWIARAQLPKKYQQSSIAIWTAVVVALSPWSVVLSRAGFEANLSQFLLAAAVAVQLKFGKSPRWLFAAAAIGALSVYTYYSARFVWPVVFVAIEITQLLFANVPTSFANSGKQLAVKLLLPLTFFLLLLVPLTRSPLFAASQQFRLSTPSLVNEQEMVHQANYYRQLSGSSVLSRVVFNQKTLRAVAFARQLSEHLSPDFLFFTGDQNLRHGTGKHGLFLLVWMPGLVVGLLWLWTHQWRTAAVLSLWWLAALVPASIPISQAHALRSVNALVPSSIFVGIGLWWLADWLNTARIFARSNIFWLGTAVVVLATVTNFALFWQYYQTAYVHRSADAWSDGYQQLVNEVNQLTNHDPAMPVLVHNIDGRIPLWFLASNTYPAKQFFQYHSQQFLFTDLNEVHFGNFPSEAEMLGWTESHLVVAQSASFTSLSPTLQSHIQILDTSYSAQGTEVGTIARYTP